MMETCIEGLLTISLVWEKEEGIVLLLAVSCTMYAQQKKMKLQDCAGTADHNISRQFKAQTLVKGSWR